MINLIFSLSIFVFSQGSDFNSYYCEEVKKPFFRIQDEKGVKYALSNRRYAHDFKLPLIKSKDKKRIFILGESAAAMLYANKDIPMEQPFSIQRNFEIFDFGMAAYESSRIKDVFYQSLAFNPDAIVLLSGNNESLNEPCPGIKAELNRRTVNLIYNVNRLFSDEREKLFNYSLEIQKKNIADMASKASEKGVKFFITTLPSNLFLPPNGERPYGKDYIKGYMAFDSGNYSIAFSVFKKLLESKKYKNEPFANYYAGLSLYRLSKAKEAYPFLLSAATYDYRMDRATRYRNEALKKLAAENKATIIDLEGFFCALSGSPLIDSKFLSDGVHWYSEYNFAVQDFFLEKLGDFFQTGFRRKAVKFTGRLKNSQEPDISFYYALSGFSSQPNLENKISERTIYFVDRILENGEKYQKNMEIAEKIIKNRDFGTANKNWLLSCLKTYFAEAYRRKGQREKSFEILDSIEEPDRGMLWNKVRFICLLEAGKRAEAEKMIKIADPNRNGFFSSYAGIDEGADQEEGEKVFDVKGDPKKNSRAKSFSDSGVEKLIKNDLKGAEADFLKALEIHPYHAEALLNMAYLKNLQGNSDMALEALSVISKNASFYDSKILCSAYLGKAEIYSKKGQLKNEKRELQSALLKCGDSLSAEIKKRMDALK